MKEQVQKYVIALHRMEVDGDYYIFDFNVPDDFVFTEGQYGIFSFVDKSVINDKPFRAFSIASAINEKYIKIAMKIRKIPSNFKMLLRDLSPGEKMSVKAPYGDFIYEKDYHAVYIAGGIGITPIRSILKSIEYKGIQKQQTLVYAERLSEYPFKDEFNQMNNLDTHYTNTIDNTSKKIEEVVKLSHEDTYFYVSGGVSFINGIKDQIMKLGISEDKIKFDRFSGYEGY